MGTFPGSVPISGEGRVPSPAPPDLKRISGQASSCRFSIPETFGSFARRAMHDVSDRQGGRESTEHNAAAPDTWPRVRDCAYGQADAVRTGTARCAGPDPRCSGLSTIPPVTRCVVVDLAPQAMIGRVWVRAGSIMTDKTHRQGAITRCIHAIECQAAVPWFTLITRLPQLLSHMSNLECTRPARTPTSICACVALLMSYILMYQRRPDAPALPRNAASRDSWSMMILHLCSREKLTCSSSARTTTCMCACVALLISYILPCQRRPDAPAL